MCTGLAAGVSLPPLSLDVGYPTVSSIADIVAGVQEAVQQREPGEWIRGSGWNTALLDETRNDPSRLSTKQDLDAGMEANMNPSIKAAIADAMIAVLGPERAGRQWPTKSALRAGVTLTSASDWPVSSPDWRAGVASAVSRKDQVSGNVSGPAERLSLEEALRTYTTAPAYQDGAEAWKGQLARCMAADIVVLDGTLPARAEEGEQLAATPVALTVLAGRLVYERSADTSTATPTSGSVPMTSNCTHGKTCCCQRAPELLSGKG